MKKKLVTLFFLTLALNPLFSQIKKTVLQLSQARSGMGVIAYGDKIICAGGGVPISSNTLNNTNMIEIIDSRTLKISLTELPKASMTPTCVKWQNNVVFTQSLIPLSSMFHFYDFNKNEWVTKLLLNNYKSALLAGDKLYFFNGSYFRGSNSGPAIPTGIIEGYDFQQGRLFSFIALEPRINMISYAYNNKIYFLGGTNTVKTSTRVDILDTKTGEWTLGGPLFAPRHNDKSDYTQIGSKIIFADGEIYDMSQNKSISKPLNTNFTYTASITHDNIAYFTGGYNYNSNILTTTDSIRIYNDENDTWTNTKLSQSRTKITATKVLDNILFVGGYSLNGVSKVIDIYNTKTKKWTIDSLDAGRYNIKAAISENKLFLVAGDVSIFSPGFVNSSLNFSFDPSTFVDVLEFPEEITPSVLEPELEVFPNPFNSELTIRWSPKTDGIAKLKIFDSLGQNILNTTIQNNQKVLNINQLATGTYLIYLETLKGILTKKVVKY